MSCAVAVMGCPTSDREPRGIQQIALPVAPGPPRQPQPGTLQRRLPSLPECKKQFSRDCGNAMDSLWIKISFISQ